MQWLGKSKRLQGLIIGLLLTACAGATGIGAGCRAYAEHRLSLPSDEVLVAAPRELLEWLNLLDARMLGVCK